MHSVGTMYQTFTIKPRKRKYAFSKHHVTDSKHLISITCQPICTQLIQCNSVYALNKYHVSE